LKSVVANTLEWNAYDRELAQRILIERKAEIPHVKPKLHQPEKLDFKWVIIGYLWVTVPILVILRPINLFAYFLLTPLTGIFFGLGLITTKKTIGNGDRRPMYDQSTIRHGYNFIIIGAIFFILLIVQLFLKPSFI